MKAFCWRGTGPLAIPTFDFSFMFLAFTIFTIEGRKKTIIIIIIITIIIVIAVTPKVSVSVYMKGCCVWVNVKHL